MSKLKNNKEKGSFFKNLLSQRKYRYGGFALLMTAVILAVVILVNVVFGMIEDNWALSIDLSPSQVTAFDDATKETVKEVDKDIVIHLIYQDTTSTSLRIELEEMAKRYHALNNHITWDTIDPYTEPAKIAEFIDTNSTSLTEGSVIVSLADGSKFRYIVKSDLYNYSYVEDSTSSWGYSYQQAFNGEAKLTSAIKYVDSDDTPNVYFLTGHNEISVSNMSYLTTYLGNENYNVEELVIGNTEIGRGDTVIIVDPQVDLTDEEFEIMKTWLSDGGRLLMTVDNQTDMTELKNFNSLLAVYQLSFGEGYVVEDTNATDKWISSPVMVLPTLNEEHDITSNLAENNHRLIVYGGRPINVCDIPLSGVVYETILSSSERSSVYANPNNDAEVIAEGSQILAYTAYTQPDVYDREQDTRIVLLATKYLFVDSSLLTSSYNLDFSLSAIEWLVNRDVSVYVRASQIIDTTLEIPDAATAYTIGACLIAIPLLIAAFGVVVWVRRRRL